MGTGEEEDFGSMDSSLRITGHVALAVMVIASILKAMLPTVNCRAKSRGRQTLRYRLRLRYSNTTDTLLDRSNDWIYFNFNVWRSRWGRWCGGFFAVVNDIITKASRSQRGSAWVNEANENQPRCPGHGRRSNRHSPKGHWQARGTSSGDIFVHNPTGVFSGLFTAVKSCVYAACPVTRAVVGVMMARSGAAIDVSIMTIPRVSRMLKMYATGVFSGLYTAAKSSEHAVSFACRALLGVMMATTRAVFDISVMLLSGASCTCKMWVSGMSSAPPAVVERDMAVSMWALGGVLLLPWYKAVEYISPRPWPTSTAISFTKLGGEVYEVSTSPTIALTGRDGEVSHVSNGPIIALTRLDGEACNVSITPTIASSESGPQEEGGHVTQDEGSKKKKTKKTKKTKKKKNTKNKAAEGETAKVQYGVMRAEEVVHRKSYVSHAASCFVTLNSTSGRC